MTDDVIGAIDVVLSENWADAARWTPTDGWSEPELEPADDDPDSWFMDHDENFPPPLITRDGVWWLG